VHWSIVPVGYEFMVRRRHEVGEVPTVGNPAHAVQIGRTTACRLGKANGVWPSNDAWPRVALSAARRSDTGTRKHRRTDLRRDASKGRHQMPFVLKTTTSAPELKDCFDLDFDTDKPVDHIHGAILNLCNAGFDKPRIRAGLNNLVIDLSTLQSSYSNIELFFRNALADGEISFRPDTPIHANDEGRYPGGKLKDRPDWRPRHFEFGAVGGGMRVVFDNDTEEIYISAHYSFPGKLVATAGSAQEDWLLTTKARLNGECLIMIDHSSGETRKQREEINRLRDLVIQGQGKGLSVTTRDGTRKADTLEQSLKLRASRNKAFSTWLRDPKAFMSQKQISELYGL